jgi:signal transduction histidine kinase
VYLVDELEFSNKQKERLMNIMAHELRSPISGITSVADTLLQDATIGEEQSELIRMIENTSANTLSLINELLEERNNPDIILHKSEVDINKVIRQIVALLKFKAKEKQQTILEDYRNNLPLITVDTEKFERVISNLITNAIKFSEPEKEITIKTALVQNGLQISVKDNGIGMNENQLKKLFNPQYTIKRLGTMGEKSFGMGLSICQQIIEKHNGKLWAESTENLGSTFIIQLPLK